MNKSIAPLVTAMRSGDKAQFVAARYALAEEGAAIAVSQQSIEQAQLGHLPLQFILFIDCSLRFSSLRGANLLALGFLRCNMEGIDLCACKGTIDAERCNLIGARWDEITYLGSSTDRVPSTLAACEIDNQFRRFLAKQSVTFPRRLNAQRRALYQEACSADVWS